MALNAAIIGQPSPSCLFVTENVMVRDHCLLWSPSQATLSSWPWMALAKGGKSLLVPITARDV